MENNFLMMFQDVFGALTDRYKVIAKTFDDVINEYTENEIKTLMFMSIDVLDASVLDVLAQNWDIVVYDISDTIEQKREIIKRGLELNRKTGTPYAIKEGIKLRGYKASIINDACTEPLIYDGTGVFNGLYDFSGGISIMYAWAFFGVLIDLETTSSLTTQEIKNIIRIIKKYKGVQDVFACLRSAYLFNDAYNRAITDEIGSIDIDIKYIENGIICLRYDGATLYDGSESFDNIGISDNLTITVS